MCCRYSWLLRHSSISKFFTWSSWCNINKDAIVGEKCIIGAKVTLGNAFLHGGAPKLGKHVYVGVGTFIGGDVQVADYVVIGANSVLTKDVLEPGVIVAGVPAKVIRKLTEEEKKMLEW